jgi:hypothetical protein
VPDIAGKDLTSSKSGHPGVGDPSALLDPRLRGSNDTAVRCGSDMRQLPQRGTRRGALHELERILSFCRSPVQ